MLRRGLYAITHITSNSDCNKVAAQVAAAIAGGAVMIQYRDKISTPIVRREFAQTLQSICARHCVPLIINDDIELAAAVGAAGVHVGKSDADIRVARTRLGASAIIGASCYNDLARAARAADAGASYLAFGSFFPSPTKPDAVVAERELLSQARREFQLPLVAIGGITAANAPQLVTAGADMVAVISDVFGASDVRAAAQRLARVFTVTTQQTGQQ